LSSSGPLALLPEHWLRDLVKPLRRLMEGFAGAHDFPRPRAASGTFFTRQGRTPNVEALVALRLDLDCFLWPGSTHEEAHHAGARPI